MTVLAAYLVLHKKGILSFLSAVLLLTLSMGCYQAWIGFATGTIVMTLMLDCLDERPLPEILRRAGKALAMGLAGAAVYFVILQIELHRYNVELSDKGPASARAASSAGWAAKFCRLTAISKTTSPQAPTTRARLCC